ncbi:glutathione S-transferase theta-2-like isoform X2 [Biomphalaria glabrata]|uniref:Glutathione S-transferase theta-2-like isoform X2 n=1 Tax=Biomphalaria glabrata TaxID=6526 RepID=A0A9U8ECU3_BIOGL|nr:glutathione S-transferase theta-2-like isoform X2 [Biomphalaria glabrata]XP_013081706.2 glutathione S-transferase theta-2-like isoform X2 [Biomphalaria glabrata]XP_013081707.2 glutathione S-transferase theta-2-like isoform X2 [Biomphalaria glabrata]XP_013081708.2 glutathione S-transferase theta-2-like isoform X2 [Biomphalaria glabrata]XP_013081709.2 glutathione S-transferase theta-2-like isoform X2 [Biomphalaria glabrata]XP_013081710.2 glutathione S-transferase theta-2-like isoform X2 [Biom
MICQMPTLRLYYDLLSQPSRAVYIFLRLNNVPFEPKPVALRKDEHQTDEFKKINPFSLVPVVDDDGFLLTESMAILKYVIGKYELGDHWFPQHNLKKQARVEEYLHWHQFNTRGMCASLFQQLLIIPKSTGKPVNQEEVEKMRKKVSEVLKQLETYFLKTQTYIGGGNEVSIADLFAVCELMQLYACHEHSLYEKSPIIKAWMDRVKNDTNPYFDEAHKIIYRTFDVYKQIASKL